MKNFRVVIIVFAAISLLSFSCKSHKRYSLVKIKTQADTVSYYLGQAYGGMFKQNGVDSVINMSAFLKGYYESVGKDSVKPLSMEIQMYLNNYFTELSTKKLKTQYKDYIAKNQAFLEENAKKDSVKVLPSGVQYVVLREGNGPKPTLQDRVKVNYKGWMIDGTVFDDSYQRNEPAVFTVRGIIPGWTSALQEMHVGSKWRIYIPENLAYGSNPRPGGVIKPFSTLIFEVELLAINPEEPKK